jgi:forkhead box protein P
MLQQTLAFHQLLQHQLIATQQQQQLQQLQQIKDKRSSPNPIQSSLQNSLASHGHLLSGLPSLPLPLPQTPTSVSTNHKADSEKSHSPVTKADERTKSPFDANANRFSPKKSPTPRESPPPSMESIHPLFVHNMCKWPGCEAHAEDFGRFLKWPFFRIFKLVFRLSEFSFF